MPPKPLDFQVLSSEKSVQTPLGVHISERRKTPKGGYATSDDSFIRHDTYFFKDGNVTFLVGDTLYCVHRYFFSRDSIYFSTRLAQLDIRDHEALPTIISIGNIERNDFEALLSVLYPVNFEIHELSYKQWKSVLHLSTLWGFASLRKLALKSIKPPTPHDQLVLARTYSVDQWVLPALAALCSRTLPLTLDEARQMDMKDVILVATIREEIRGGALRVDVADIPSHIKMVLAGKPNHPMGNGAYLSMSGTTGQESDSTMPSGVKLNTEVEHAKMTGVVLSFGSQERSAKEGGTNTSDVGCSPNEVLAESPDTRQGIEQPHVKGTPQVLLEKVVAMPAMQIRETQKPEETPLEAAAWPAQEIFTMGAIVQKPEALLRPIRGLPGQTEGLMKDKLAPEAMTEAEAAEEQIKVKAVEDKKTTESVGLHAMQALLPQSTIPCTSDILPNDKNTSPNTEIGLLPSDSSPGASVQRLSATGLAPHGPQSMLPANSFATTPSSAGVMHSFVSDEHVPMNDKQDGHAIEGKCDQTQNTTMGLPTEDITEPTASQLGHSSLVSGGANVASTTSMPTSGTLAGNDQASMHGESMHEDESGSPKLTKVQRKRMREKARKQAHIESDRKNKSHPPYWETASNVEHKPCRCSVCLRSGVSLAC